MEQVIKPKSIGGLVRSLSGLFITKENPKGLTPKECTVLAVLVSVTWAHALEARTATIITKEVRVDVSNQLNQSLQVTTNYINKFKKKGVVQEHNKVHPIFFTTKIIIDGTDIL